MIDYQIWGLDPRGYHLTNVLLHLLCAILVAVFAERLSHDRPRATAVACLFAVNPLTTSAVTYVSGRADSLALAGMLGALLLFVAYRESEGRAIWLLIGSLVCFVAALFSRENAMMLPALVVITAWARTPRPFRKALADALPYFIVLAAFIVWRSAVVQLVDKPLAAPWDIPLALRVQIFFRSIATYLGLLCWPFHLRMDRQVAHASGWLTMTGIVAALLLGWALWWTARRQRIAWFGLSWFVITLLPLTGTLNLVATVAEHWLYVPMIGFFLALAAVVPWNRLTRWACIVLILILAGRSSLRNLDWANGAALFARQTRDAPGSARGFINLGHTLIEDGRIDEGLQALAEAERLSPRSTTAKYNLATTYHRLGRDEAALAKLAESLAIDPDDETTWELIAEIHEARGDFAQARQHYRLATTCTPRVAVRFHYLEFLLRQHAYGEALRVASDCCERDPGNARAWNYLGLTLTATNQPDAAERAFRQATGLDRHDQTAARNLVALRQRAGGPTP